MKILTLLLCLLCISCKTIPAREEFFQIQAPLAENQNFSKDKIKITILDTIYHGESSSVVSNIFYERMLDSVEFYMKQGYSIGGHYVSSFEKRDEVEPVLFEISKKYKAEKIVAHCFQDKGYHCAAFLLFKK